MTHEEFIKLANVEITPVYYFNTIEPSYMSDDSDKKEFVEKWLKENKKSIVKAHITDIDTLSRTRVLDDKEIADYKRLKAEEPQLKKEIETLREKCRADEKEIETLREKCGVDETEEKADVIEYGAALSKKVHERLCAGEFKRSGIPEYEKFLLDRGGEFKTEDDLKAGYDRKWKASHQIILTEQEFIKEAQGYIYAPHNYDMDTLINVYYTLAKFAQEKMITPFDVYNYARYGCCLRNPEALIAYQSFQYGKDRWHVNDCDTEITNDKAKMLINDEWGFETSRIKIIGKAYYESTDWQFIRFDCMYVSWLWTADDLYQVYT